MIYLELFWTFFTIGAFTFGGGYAMLPLIQIEVVNKGWLANEAVVNFIAVSESTPGPFAINMATYVGSEMGGVLGAACATLGVVMPSFIIILIVAKCYDRFKKSKLVKGAMSGLKPAVIGMIGTAVLSIGKTVFVQPGLLFSAVLFGVMAVLAFRKVHPIIIICISAAAGILAGILGI
ncbi:MAG: chromate transporter [Ruminococcaceae bacterium]|nr:chromate transporter [Oscillospiraceae bacterium]